MGKSQTAARRASLKDDVHELERIDGRCGADTIRLWESYRDQAYLWRALSLLQIPATFVAILSAIIMYTTADTIIEVPQMPQPGNYSVKQLPDSEFINVATVVVNNIATYQPNTAKEQFSYVRKYLWEPALTEFEASVIGQDGKSGDLKVIEETRRSQLFIIQPQLTRVERFPSRDKIVVRLVGSRTKLISKELLPADNLAYYIDMTTIPRSNHNDFGIVVTNIRIKKFDEPVELKRDEATYGIKNLKRAQD